MTLLRLGNVYREPYEPERAGKWQQTGSVNQSVCHAVCVYGCREPQSDARATDVLYALEMLHDLKAQFV